MVDLPDGHARNLVRFVLHNDGRLAGRRRNRFGELPDEELAAVELALRDAKDAADRRDDA